MKVTQLHHSSGPSIGLLSGWNFGMASHYKPLREALEIKLPTVVATTLDLKFWNVDLEKASSPAGGAGDPFPSYDRKLVLKEEESLVLDHFTET